MPYAPPSICLISRLSLTTIAACWLVDHKSTTPAILNKIDHDASERRFDFLIDERAYSVEIEYNITVTLEIAKFKTVSHTPVAYPCHVDAKTIISAVYPVFCFEDGF